MSVLAFLLALAGGEGFTFGYYYNSSFYEDDAHTKLIAPSKNGFYVGINNSKLYYYNGSQYVFFSGSGSGGYSDNAELEHLEYANSGHTGFASEADLDAVEELIPNAATAQNQLADKSFVNSSIATNTAYYISNNGEPFISVAQLEEYSGTVTNNDYAFVTGTDEHGNTYFDRYKATVAGDTVTWAKEYRLNNSSFTSVQWQALNSGITEVLVASYSAHISDTSVHVTSSDKANWNNILFYN